MEYLKDLNEPQKQAALTTDGPLLIVAGAGAGKTKTITHRIAYMMSGGVPGYNILALTFTNKAAAEMRERVRRLMPENHNGTPLLTTFHALGARLLREFYREAGVSRGFVIWDRDDSIRAIKKIAKDLGLGDNAPRNFLSGISRQKGEGVTASEYEVGVSNHRERTLAQVWNAYEKVMHDEDGLDFDDLLLRTLSVLQKNPAVLSKLQARWTHLTIDEYQDTNRAQYEIARLLAGERRNICVVGDIDQCLAAGTQVAMADGSFKAIEDIKAGEHVLSNYGSGDMRPARISATRKRSYRGSMVRITTKDGRVLTSTSEHMHFAGYRLGITPQKYFTYVMHKRGVGWRLGVSQVHTKGQKKPMLGFVQRSNQEHSDALWILAAHDTPQEARVLEYTTSLEYGIPTIPFVARKKGNNGTKQNGKSQNGYVHDQTVIDAIFKKIDTESSAIRLFAAYGLSPEHPHHRPQATMSDRRNIVTALCGDRRGTTPMHRISVVGRDQEGARLLREAGFSVRSAKKESMSWRFETAHKEWRELVRIVARLKSIFPDAVVVETARLGGSKENPKDGNSLPFLPAGSVRPGMAVFNEQGGFDIVQKTEEFATSDENVYDLDVEYTHNFVAEGIVTHNCIYSWRGAALEHLLSFEESFPGAKVIILEQNYRSTRTILTAANSVIAKNIRRKEKNLFTENETGEPIAFYSARNEVDEAWYIAQSIQKLLENSMKAGEMAILYRENFQSRVLEEALLHVNIPYRVLGVKFFERAEVKDVLSYLRAALNPKSKGDIARIISTPPRGIGKTTLDKMLAGEPLPGAAALKVEKFRNSLAKIKHAIETLPASEAVRFAAEESGIENMLQGDTEEGSERLANIHELVNLAVRYDDALPPEGIERLLEEAALQSEQDSIGADGERAAISLMTVHASKGLEFDAVFVTGLEQGLFPSMRESEDRDTEEERRLFYVAVTRARKRLFLSYAHERMKYGSREVALPSEFFDDIDQRLLNTAKPKRGLLDNWDDVIR